jgi:hypothetical protein
MINTLGIWASQFDYNALEFLNNAGISDPTQRLAINYLTVNLKLNNLWDRMKVIYPFVGGISAAHQYNLKDPRSLSAAFLISFSTAGPGTSWTHDSNGIQGNGINAAADTRFVPNAHLATTNSVSHGSYIRNTSTGIWCGCNLSTGFLYINRTSVPAQWTGAVNSNASLGGQFMTWTASTVPGFTSTVRSGATASRAFYNGVKVRDVSTTFTSAPNNNYYLGARNNSGAAANFSNAQISYHYIGAELSDAEMLTHYNIVQQFQTILGRNV